MGEFSDEGKTGMNLKRKGWRDVLALAQKRAFDVLAVTYMSRLARGEVFHVAEYLLKEERVTVEMVYEKFTPDMAGRTNKRVKVLTDAMYAESVSEWTKTKQSRMLEAGHWLGGVYPFGIQTETVPGTAAVVLAGGKVKPPPKRPIPRPEEAPYVVRCFEMMQEKNNIAIVQRYLQTLNTGRRWDMDKVRRLLSNPIYRGSREWGGRIRDGVMDPIIPEDLWNAVQALLAERNNQPQPSNGEGRELGTRKGRAEARSFGFHYYFRGRVTCKHCGGRMTPASHHGATMPVFYYECVQATKRSAPGGCNCPVKRVNARTVHEAIIAEIDRCGKHPTRLAEWIRATARELPKTDMLDEDIRRLTRNKREATKKRDACLAALEQGARGPSLKTIVERINEIEDHITTIDSEIRSKQASKAELSGVRPNAAEISEAWKHFMESWGELSEEERTDLLEELVEEITFFDKQKGALRINLQSALSQVVNYNTNGCGGRTYLEQFLRESRSVCTHHC